VSAQETYDGGPIVEQRSKIKLALNAKRDAVWEITAVEGATDEELHRLGTLAIAQHNRLVEELIAPKAAA
jgi:hypothetical protein